MLMKSNLFPFSWASYPCRVWRVFPPSAAGMLGQYNVGNCRGNAPHPKMRGQQRRYFIAAEKVLWDYGPQGYDKFTGFPLNTSGR